MSTDQYVDYTRPAARQNIARDGEMSEASNGGLGSLVANWRQSQPSLPEGNGESSPFDDNNEDGYYK